MNCRYTLLHILCTLALPVLAQTSRLGEHLQYHLRAEGTAGQGTYAPLWFSSNRYGLGSIKPNSALLRAVIGRSASADSLHHWRIGYGADFVGALNHDSHFTVQQLYADIQYKRWQLSVGQKGRLLELKNQALSSGALTSGINARPLPQVRLEVPDFWTIPRTGGWLALRGHLAYGLYTDQGWQRTFTGGTTNLRSARSLYHSKAGFLRIGNRERFPLTLTGGIEMSAQFGGEVWNLRNRADHKGTIDSHQKMDSGLKGMLKAFIPGGSDANDGDFANVAGNHLGSWHLRADYERCGWKAALYAEHFFEDHSQLGFAYDWKDMLYGLEFSLPRNPFVHTFLYEHLRTTHQSGPIYHDATATLPVSIAGVDEYYNHHVYGAWQHAGRVMGHPLLLSPIYNTNGAIQVQHNRVTAHHFGLSGQPLREMAYRLLFTHQRSLGTYPRPLVRPAYGNYLLIEATYTPRRIPGLALTAAYGQNGGRLLGRSHGGRLTLTYSGWLNPKKP